MTGKASAMVAACLAISLGAAVGGRAADAPAPVKPEQPNPAEARLLEVGKVAPDFTLPMVTGGEVTLANMLKFGKAVLVGFWAVKPESGGNLLPKLQKLQEDLEAKGLQTVIINPVDTAAETKQAAEAAKVQFPVAVDGKETNHAVTGVYRARILPTFYLLDPNGKVLWRSIGLKEASLKEALEKAGIK